MELLDLNAIQAGVLLRNMVASNDLIRVSRGVTTRYVKYQSEVELPPYSQIEKVIAYVKEKRFVTNKDVQDLLGITSGSTNVLLSKMNKSGIIKRISRGKYALTDTQIDYEQLVLPFID